MIRIDIFISWFPEYQHAWLPYLWTISFVSGLNLTFPFKRYITGSWMCQWRITRCSTPERERTLAWLVTLLPMLSVEYTPYVCMFGMFTVGKLNLPLWIITECSHSALFHRWWLIFQRRIYPEVSLNGTRLRLLTAKNISIFVAVKMQMHKKSLRFTSKNHWCSEWKQR